jgi:hypothetical protein
VRAVHFEVAHLFSAPRGFALACEAEIDHDAIKPRAERGITAKTTEFGKDAQKGFLRYVFGFIGIVQHLKSQIDRAGAIAANQFGKGAFVAVATGCQQRGFVRRQRTRRLEMRGKL